MFQAVRVLVSPRLSGISVIQLIQGSVSAKSPFKKQR